MTHSRRNLFQRLRAIKFTLLLLLAMVLIADDLGCGQHGLCPFGAVQAAKRIRKKRRRFDAEQVVKDMKDTW